MAKFTRANLTEADLRGSSLVEVDLRGATLVEADLMGAFLNDTVFANTILTGAKGLEHCQHFGPSTIDHRTLRKNPNFPLEFLQGCGFSDLEIEFYKLYQKDLSPGQITDIGKHIIDLRSDPAIQYHSCFISYSSKDDDYVRKLHDDLQEAGVRCWFPPKDLRIGDKFRAKIDEAIRSHEKLLLILSKAAIDSGWVEYEANRAHSREMKSGETVLLPVRLDDAILKVDATWADFIRDERHIGDFRQWIDTDKYADAFQRLLRDLRAGK